MKQSKSLIPFDQEKTQKRLQSELDSLDAGLFAQNLGSGLRIKAFWNISRHKLFRAQGCKTMKEFVESTGYTYRRVMQLLQEGDLLAEMMFPADMPPEKQWITPAHVKTYVEAKREARLLQKHDPLRLPDGKQLMLDDVEAELEVQQLADALASITAGTDRKQLADKKGGKRNREIDLFIESITDSAIQVYAISRAGGFNRADKSRKRARYYIRLCDWLLRNDKAAVEWCEYDAALALLDEAQQTGAKVPAHVVFALDLEQ